MPKNTASFAYSATTSVVLFRFMAAIHCCVVASTSLTVSAKTGALTSAVMRASEAVIRWNIVLTWGSGSGAPQYAQ